MTSDPKICHCGKPINADGIHDTRDGFCPTKPSADLIQSTLERALGYLETTELGARRAIAEIPADTKDSGYRSDRQDAEELIGLIDEIRAVLNGEREARGGEQREDTRTLRDLVDGGGLELSGAECSLIATAINAAPGWARPFADLANVRSFRSDFAIKALRIAIKDVESDSEVAQTIDDLIVRIEVATDPEHFAALSGAPGQSREGAQDPDCSTCGSTTGCGTECRVARAH